MALPPQSTQQIRQRLDNFWDTIKDIVLPEQIPFVVSMAEQIYQFTSPFVTTPPGFREQVKLVSSHAHELIDLIRSFENDFPEVKNTVHTSYVIDAVARFRHHIDAIGLPQGARPEERLNAARKYLTARQGYLFFVTRRPDLPRPTGTDEGPYVTFCGTLFEIATDQTSNLLKQCRKVVKEEKEKQRRVDEALRARRQE